MFDVDWSDPTRESVGDRRARKGRGKAQGKDGDASADTSASQSLNDAKDLHGDHVPKAGDPDQDSNRNSGSIRSSVSSIEKQFGFFGTKNRTKGNSTSRRTKATSVGGSSLSTRTVEEQPQNESVYLLSTQKQRVDPPKRISSLTGSVCSKLEDDADRAPGGSLLGCDITNPQPGCFTLYQELGDGVSMITKITEVSIRGRADQDSAFLVSKTSICAGDFDLNGSLEAVPSGGSSARLVDPSTSTQFNEVFYAPRSTQAEAPVQRKSPNGASQHQLPVIKESCTDETISHNPVRLEYMRTPRPMLSAPAISPATLRPANNPENWKAPDEWIISPAESAIFRRTAEDRFDLPVSNGMSALNLDLTRMQREVDNMLQAHPQAILHRLKETTTTAKEQGTYHQRDDTFQVIDAALGNEARKMEKQRWLLSALYNMETVWDPQDQASTPAARPTVLKVLALFESQATASYLAAVNNTMPVYHLATEPLGHKQYPNIHPVACSAVSASAINFSPESFSSVSCIPIISILPSPEIPKLLQKIHRVLAPGGYLHLVVIDPWPVISSMGPALQRWIDDNLVFNLELQFRCIHPSRMFPVWLEDARLRAAGSIITHTRFAAIPPSYEPAGNGDPRSRDNAEDEALTKKELRTTVGRMLWQEIWGPLITDDKKWWDVPEIVDECIERQTHWEYKIIAACRASEDSDHAGDWQR